MARIVRDDIDRFFQYDIEISTKTLYIGSADSDWDGYETGVDFQMAEKVIKALHILGSKDKDKPINIIMNNPGGDWYHGMAVYDVIKLCDSTVNIKVYGHVMSMGSVILQAADNRLLSPNSKFMIHYGYNGVGGHTKIVEKWVDETKRVDHFMEDIYLEKMLEKDAEEKEDRYLEKALADIMNRLKELEYPKPAPVKYNFSTVQEKRKEDVRKVLKEMLNFDTILTAEETVRLGLADEVLET